MSLVLKDITYRYSQGTAYEKTALDHVNLEIHDGEFIGIIGHPFRKVYAGTAPERFAEGYRGRDGV